ncbi:MAG: GAF domain-containing sensor histidine kinase [Chloroflexi bacterium]|nr:GAF domain-containing sensor histidine kinase [Chloroflexota bacterium]
MFKRLRWLTILLPAFAVGLIELMNAGALEKALSSPWDALIVAAAVVGLAFIFSVLTFRRIDSLTGELAGRNAELERRNATVRALHRVSLAVTATSSLDQILQAIVDQARMLLAADAAVLVLDDGTGRRTLRSSSGDETLIQPAGSGEVEDHDPALRDPAVGSRLASPLHRAGMTIGSLVVGSRSERTYGADEVEILSSLAGQAAIAVENARLQDRLRELAVVAERERIAREMHDGLAQVLGYVNTKSQAVEQLLGDGRVSDAQSQIRELAAAARSTYVDVREAIFGLRSVIEPGVGLIPAVERYVARFSEAAKLVVQVRASDDARAAILPPSVEDEVFRIVQESLTNVRKHAEAGRAVVELAVDAGALVLSVTDDGRGMFEAPTLASDWPHYGLAAMRERTESIGGTIAWTAMADGGTAVRLTVPLSPRQPTSSAPAASGA